MLFMEIISVFVSQYHRTKNNKARVTQSYCASSLVLHYTSDVQRFYVYSLMHAADVFGKCEFL